MNEMIMNQLIEGKNNEKYMDLLCKEGTDSILQYILIQSMLMNEKESLWVKSIQSRMEREMIQQYGCNRVYRSLSIR